MRTALVTGAGSGIGAAVARRMASAGLRVALLGRTRKKLEAVAAEIDAASAAGDSAPVIVEARQERESEVREAVATVKAATGRVDVLVNNAAIYDDGTAVDSSLESWDEMLAINFRGPLLLTRAVVPIMRRLDGGVIVNVSSTLGLRPIAGTAPYAVSKAALVMLTRCLALEEAKHGIRVLAICPGVVDTPIHATPERGEAFLADVAKLHPLGRVGTADEVAGLIEQLARPESSWMTGATVTIDGGLSLA